MTNRIDDSRFVKWFASDHRGLLRMIDALTVLHKNDGASMPTEIKHEDTKTQRHHQAKSFEAYCLCDFVVC